MNKYKAALLSIDYKKRLWNFVLKFLEAVTIISFGFMMGIMYKGWGVYVTSNSDIRDLLTRSDFVNQTYLMIVLFMSLCIALVDFAVEIGKDIEISIKKTQEKYA